MALVWCNKSNRRTSNYVY